MRPLGDVEAGISCSFYTRYQWIIWKVRLALECRDQSRKAHLFNSSAFLAVAMFVR